MNNETRTRTQAAGWRAWAPLTYRRAQPVELSPCPNGTLTADVKGTVLAETRITANALRHAV